MEAQAAGLQAFAERALGVSTWVDLACLPARSTEDPGEYHIGRVIDRRVGDGASILFVLPAAFDLNIWQRTMLGEELGAARRRHAGVSIHHDSVDPTHPLLVDCFAGQILRALDERGVAPRNAGLVLVADGQGEPATRADSYRLMRLIWEQAGLGRGEVGFVRHPQPFLPETLERCLGEPLDWLLLPQCQWDGELCDFARVMLDDHRRAHPEAAGWRLLDPPRDHPAILAWLEQRMLRLWQEKRARQAARIPSARNELPPAQAGVWSGAGLGAGGRSADPAAGRMCRAGPGFRRARRDPRAGPPAGRALPGEGDLARLRAGDLHGTAGARPPARRAARPGGPAGGTYEQPECGRRGDRLGSRRRAAPHLGPAAGRRIPAADRVGGGDRPARGPVPERDRGVVGRRLLRRPRTSGPRSGTSRSGIRSWPVSCPRP